MVFIESAQSAPYVGYAAIANFEPEADQKRNTNPVGQVNWRSYENPAFTSVYGQFSQGFEDDTNIDNYKFFTETEYGKIDYTEEFRKIMKISSTGGIAPFQVDFKGEFTEVNKIVGGQFTIKHKEEELTSAEVKHV